MMKEIDKLPSNGIFGGYLPLAARILWFFGVPTLFAVVLLAYILYEAPLQRWAIIQLSSAIRHHDDSLNDLVRASNYESAILRAICLAIVPANKSEQARCQPLFTKELDANNNPVQ